MLGSYSSYDESSSSSLAGDGKHYVDLSEVPPPARAAPHRERSVSPTSTSYTTETDGSFDPELVERMDALVPPAAADAAAAAAASAHPPVRENSDFQLLADHATSAGRIGLPKNSDLFILDEKQRQPFPQDCSAVEKVTPTAAAAATPAAKPVPFDAESEPLLVRESSSIVIVDAIGAVAKNVWEATYIYQLTGDLRVHEVLLYIFLFLQLHMKTMLNVSAVSYAWRERAMFLPQWNILSLKMHPFGRLADRLRKMGVLTTIRFEVHSREAFVQRRIADRIALREEAREIRHEKLVMCKFWSSWYLKITAYFWTINVGILAFSFFVGYAPSIKVYGDVQIGATVWFSNLLFTVLFIPLFAIYVTEHRETSGRKQRIRFYAISHVICTVLIALGLSVIVALLGTRVQALRQLNELPTLAVTCNAQMNSTTMPSQVFIADTRDFRIVSNVSSAANGTISYVVLESTNTSVCPQGTPTRVAVSLPVRFNFSDYRWPPVNGSAFFRTATSTRYFNLNDNADNCQRWYRSENWTELGIPLITHVVGDDVRVLEEHYLKYLFIVLGICGALTLFPAFGQLRSQRFSEAWIWVTYFIMCLALNPIVMVAFGATCAFTPKPWCMISYTSSVTLMSFGILFVVGPIIVIILSD